MLIKLGVVSTFYVNAYESFYILKGLLTCNIKIQGNSKEMRESNLCEESKVDENVVISMTLNQTLTFLLNWTELT